MYSTLADNFTEQTNVNTCRRKAYARQQGRLGLRVEACDNEEVIYKPWMWTILGLFMQNSDPVSLQSILRLSVPYQNCPNEKYKAHLDLNP